MLMNDVMQGRLEAGKKQGHPRTHYIQNIRDWTDMNTYSVYNTARRRDEWRKWPDWQCRLSTQKKDVPDDHPGDAEEEVLQCKIMSM